MKKRGLLIISSIIAIVTLIFIYWNITYIDETVTQGQAYGFQIGNSKDVSYRKAKKAYAGKDAYILHPLDSNDFGPHNKITFRDDEYAIIASRDYWEIYFSKEYQDFIKLSFKDMKLNLIYRHRQKFELP